MAKDEELLSIEGLAGVLLFCIEIHHLTCYEKL
jgi:hypothetical protein